MTFGTRSNGKIRRRRRPSVRGLVAALLCALFTLVPPPSPSVLGADDNVREAFSSVLERWDSLRGYRCTYTAKSWPADKEPEGFTARYLFAKPSSVRMEIYQGDGKGSILLWEGGDKVRVRRGGVLSLFPMKLSLRNSLIMDAFGQDLKNTTWKYILDEGSQGLREGRLQLLGEDTLGGRRVQVFANQYGPDREPFFRDVVYVDSAYRWPLKVVRFDKAGNIIQESSFQDVEIDPEVTPTAFREF